MLFHYRSVLTRDGVGAFQLLIGALQLLIVAFQLLIGAFQLPIGAFQGRSRWSGGSSGWGGRFGGDGKGAINGRGGGGSATSHEGPSDRRARPGDGIDLVGH